jgi:hypothetical protein
MSYAFSAVDPSSDPKRRARKQGIARWLSLGAAPTFAIMALLTLSPLAGPMGAPCSAASGNPLSGMLAMYLLMSAFHLPSWLTLISRRRGSPDSDARRRQPMSPAGPTHTSEGRH